MKTRKLISFVMALAMCTTFAVPSYAETGIAAETPAAAEDSIDVETESDVSEEEADIDADEDAADEPEVTQSAEDCSDYEDNDPADMTVETEDDIAEITAEESADEETDTDDVQLLDDEMVYMSGWSYSWDPETGTLTLSGEMPNTDSVDYHNIAYGLNVDRTKIKKIVFSGPVKANLSTDGFFCGMTSLTEIVGLSNFDTSGTGLMGCMFSECSSLRTLDLSSMDTSSAVIMDDMFFGCSSLITLNISNFDTHNVTSMYKMFFKCSSLASIDVSGFDTSKVESMVGMFCYCSNLTKLDLSSFDTSKADLENMFRYCSNLETILVSDKWTNKKSNSSDIDKTFIDCKKLVGGNGTVYDSKKIKVKYAQADGGPSNPGYLTSIDDWNSWNSQTKTLTIRSQLPDTGYYDNKFCNLAYLAGVDPDSVEKIVVSEGTKTGKSAWDMFYNMKNLKSIEGLNNLDMSKATDTSCMFKGCSSLKYINLESFDMSHVTITASMFAGCSSLNDINFPLGFKVTESMTLPNADNTYVGWRSVQEPGIVSGSGTYAVFTTKGKDRYVRIERIYPKGIYVSYLSFAIAPGSTRQLTYKINPSDCTENKVVWSSSDPSIASVSSTGLVTAKKEGSCDITCKCVADNSVMSTCRVAVVKMSSTPAKPTVVVKTAFGGKTMTFSCTDSDAVIYYNIGSSNITTSSKKVNNGGTVFFNTPMAKPIYFKAYKNGQWSELGKNGLNNVQIAKPIVASAGGNNFKVYTQTKNSYIVYTLDGSKPAIEEGTQTLKVKNGRLVWATSTTVTVKKGQTLKAIAIRNGLVTSEVTVYTNK